MARMRFSIAGLVIYVALFAVGFAAIRNPSSLWASTLFSVTLSTLSLAVLAAVYRRARRRAFWVGFAFCGWLYLIMTLGPGLDSLVGNHLLSTAILEMIYHRLAPVPPAAVGAIGALGTASTRSATTLGRLTLIDARIVRTGGFGGPPAPSIPPPNPWEAWTAVDRDPGDLPIHVSGVVFLVSPEPYHRIGHSLMCLLVALAGGAVARLLHATRDRLT
jgi:hypothetical protein